VLALAIIALSGWCVALTVLCLSLVRQMAVIRLAAMNGGAPTFDPALDGPAVGSKVPNAVLRQLSTTAEFQRTGLATVVFMSASCGPCRDVAEQVVRRKSTSPDTVFLVAGRPRVAEDLINLLRSADRPVISDPDAHEIVQAMDIHGSPFAFRIEHERIEAKAFLKSADDLETVATNR